MYLLRNQSLFGPSRNDQKLDNSILVFLLTNLAGKNKAINLCSNHVFNVNSDYLQKLLLSFLEKAKEYNFEMAPTMFDGASINSKVNRMLLKELSENLKKMDSYCKIKARNFFLMMGKDILFFCITRTTKSIQNALFRKGKETISGVQN